MHDHLRFERERRFLVADRSITDGWSHVLITQGYLLIEPDVNVRVRRIQRSEADGSYAADGIDATIAVKGIRIGDQREEYETYIDPFLASSILAKCRHMVVKRRFQVVLGEAWDIDVFLGENDGLVIAEIEGEHVRSLDIPLWASHEITARSEYNNEELARRPFETWNRNDEA